MLYRMPKPGDVIQNLAENRLFVLFAWNEKINKTGQRNDSNCFVRFLALDRQNEDYGVIYYDSWVFLIDSDISNTNNISEE